MMTIYAPFTDEQVLSLNAFQRGEKSRPFTCAACSRAYKGEHVLVAGRNGLACRGCDFRQSWAIDWMLDWSWERYQNYE